MKENNCFNDILEINQTNSQDKILLALLHLLSECPFNKISVLDLCREADISRNTFYKYFSDKNAVLDYLAEEIHLAYYHYGLKKEMIRENPLFQDWYHYFSFWYEIKSWANVLVKSGLWEMISRPTPKTYNILSARAWDPYISEHSDRKEMLFEFLSAGCAQLVRSWCLNGFNKTPEEMAELVVYILSGDLKNAIKL